MNGGGLSQGYLSMLQPPTGAGTGSLQSSREDLCEAGLDDGGVELRSVRTGLGEEVFASQLYSQVAKAGGKTLAAAKVELSGISIV